jgi:hypothetical protein
VEIFFDIPSSLGRRESSESDSEAEDGGGGSPHKRQEHPSLTILSV